VFCTIFRIIFANINIFQLGLQFLF